MPCFHRTGHHTPIAILLLLMPRLTCAPAQFFGSGVRVVREQVRVMRIQRSCSITWIMALPLA
eukprot:1145373-Pelagomonas_calceolata.AAC.5